MNAPWGLESRFKLAMLACRFFDVTKIPDSYEAIGKELPSSEKLEPLTVKDFLEYLKTASVFKKSPNGLRVVQLMERMATTGLLARSNSAKPSFLGLGDQYLYMATEWEARRDLFRLVPALGPEYLYRLSAPGLVHITGTDTESGAAVAGTGFVIHPSFVVTCRHVVSDMRVDARQEFQGREYLVNEQSIHEHSEVDVAIVQVEGPPLTPLKGAIFRSPVVTEAVYTLGYPRLPGLREASVTIQRGAVTNELVTSLKGESLFLFSAIARPGNSGGPVMSEDGYLVGMSTASATAEYHPNEPFSPHYSGIPAQIVFAAVESLGLGVDLPFEHFE